ncbi:ABC transporter permease [Nocardia sp. NBC_01329]|uniref:ABC transporter permease n=1 Tax=Nocardia sp. NBC_01329 TaxID=2903594 RepID=UPI002E141F74|nr:ABC transporter permease [Nocardia sp. NBC_01329]
MTIVVHRRRVDGRGGRAVSASEARVGWTDRRAGRLVFGLVVPAALALILQVLAGRGLLPGTIPPPSVVAESLWHWVAGTPKSSVDLYAGTWWDQVWGSGRRVLLGYLVATVAAVPLGVLLGGNRVAFLALDPMIHALRTIPAPSWVPFSLVVFGLSPLSAVWLIALVAFFPIVVNTVIGVQQVPAIYRDAGRMLGASTFVIWTRVLFPAALPFVFVGLRLGVGMAWIAVVVSELIGVKSGLGYSLYQAYQFGRMDIMIAAMFTLGVLGVVSDRVVGAIGRSVVGR